MSPAPVAAPTPPVSRKVIAAFLAAVVAAVVQAVVPGFHPDVLVSGLITSAVALVAGYAYKEELKYLVPAVEAAKQK